jgi:hypothetical protein
MRKGNLLTMALVLSVLLAGVAIKSFGRASSSAATQQSIAATTQPGATDARLPTMEIVPAPVIDPSAEFFIGTGDGGAGSWIRP